MAVPDRVAAAFRCPACAGPVRAEPTGLTCAAGHVSSFQFGYVDASTDDDQADEDTRRTLDSFGYEWSHFPAVQPEDHEYWRRYFADVDLTALQGRLGLDAGCGKGRFSRFTAHHVGDLVAVDASEAVVAAAANLADEPNTVVVRADLRSMPFASGSFDFISCLGVLHHLPDPRAGFDTLVDLLAPEGLLLLYLYSRPDQPGVRAAGLAGARALRRLTVRLPHRVLRQLCRPLAALLYATLVVPGSFGHRRGWARLDRLPLATYRGHPLRSLWLDTFDRLSAPLERRYTAGEIRSWLSDRDVETLAVQERADLAGLVVLGRRR